MLVLSRHKDEVVVLVIPPSDKERVVEITTVRTEYDVVRLGFTADKSIQVHRLEVYNAIQREAERERRSADDYHSHRG